jgi:hypothetical protein
MIVAVRSEAGVDGGGMLQGGVKVDGGGMTVSAAGVDTAVCSEVRDEVAACSGVGIEDGRQRRHDGV